jgi:multidrug efflux system membrane fusion protein
MRSSSIDTMTTLSPKRRSMLVTGAPVLALVVAGFWFLTHRHDGEADAAIAKAPSSVVVTTVRAAQQNVPEYLSGIGTVTARQTVTVRTRIDGQLEKIDFREGQDVKAGQLLAQLDPRTQQAALDKAKAQLAKDQALLANADLDLHRYEKLIALNATSRQILDAQRSQVAQLQAAIQADRAQISDATTQLSYTRITAPISGRVGARLVDQGNIVHATDPNGLVVINQIDPITVVFTVPAESFLAINHALAGAHTPLTVIAYPRHSGQELGDGTLVLVNNQIDTSTGTIMLKGLFPNPKHDLWPGQYVDARVILGEQRGAITIPAAVVQRGPDGTYAYVVDDHGVAHMQAIDVARIQGSLAVIDKGLEAGQRVVLDGQYRLKPGAHVTEASHEKADPASASREVASN